MIDAYPTVYDDAVASPVRATVLKACPAARRIPLAGAILAPGKRTVSPTSRVMGLAKMNGSIATAASSTGPPGRRGKRAASRARFAHASVSSEGGSLWLPVPTRPRREAPGTEKIPA